MSRYTEKQLLAKHESAKATHLRWMELYWKAFIYVTPNRDALGQVMQYLDQGINNTRNVYSTTAPNANKLRANKLTRMLMPDNQRWGTLGYDQALLDAGELTKVDIQNAEDTMYKYLGESNLAQQSQDAFIDEGIGSGAIWIENPTIDEPLVYQSVPGFSVMPEFYEGNKVRDLWYIFSASAQSILDRYDHGELGIALVVLLEADPSQVHWIKRGVIHDPLEDDKAKIWRVVDFICIKDGPSNKIYDENFVIKKLIYFRDRVRPGEVCGRGPGIDYLSTIERLNELEALDDGATEIRAFPPTEVDETKVNLDMMTNFAGSTVPHGSFGNQLHLSPAPEVAEKIRKREMEIEAGFSVSPMGNLNQPVRTATEISSRLDAEKEETVVDVSRLLQESSKPIFENIFSILLELTLIPKTAAFKKALAADPKAILFNYQNPLGDIEKHNNMVKLNAAFEFSKNNIGPTAWMAQFKLVETQNFIAENSGLDYLYKPGSALEDLVKEVQKQAQAAPQAPNQTLPQSASSQTQTSPLTPEGVNI
jgi:hypothetical protein